MSAQILMENVLARLEKEKTGLKQDLTNLAYIPGQKGTGAERGVEAIALLAVEFAAGLRATIALETWVKEEYLKLVHPAAFDAAQKQPGEGEKVEPVY